MFGLFFVLVVSFFSGVFRCFVRLARFGLVWFWFCSGVCFGFYCLFAGVVVCFLGCVLFWFFCRMVACAFIVWGGGVGGLCCSDHFGVLLGCGVVFRCSADFCVFATVVVFGVSGGVGVWSVLVLFVFFWVFWWLVVVFFVVCLLSFVLVVAVVGAGVFVVVVPCFVL